MLYYCEKPGIKAVKKVDLQIGSSTICSYTREHAIVDANYELDADNYDGFKRCMGMEEYDKEFTLSDASGRRVYDVARGFQTPKL